jgi:hypothetical protein
MPYGIEKRPIKGPKDWAIIKKTTGEVVGRSTSKDKAIKAIQIREIKTNGK